MKPTEIDSFTDERGGSDIFDQYASVLERLELVGKSREERQVIIKIRIESEAIERRLQDMGDQRSESGKVIGVALTSLEADTYEIAIKEVRKLLLMMLTIYSDDHLSIQMLESWHRYLKEVMALLGSGSKHLADAENIIVKVRDIGQRLGSTSVDLGRNDMDDFSLHTEHIPRTFINTVEDGENVLYTWDVHIWIDTNDAVKANKLMNIVASTLGAIENVSLMITAAKVGSFLQRWVVMFKGWIAKDDTKQMLEKGAKALSSYTLDRHIETVEKTKVERQQAEENIKRLAPVDTAKKIHELDVAEREENLKAKKLANIKSALEIQKMLSEMLANGLYEVDSDYRIMINGIMAIEQISGKVEIGNFDEIDEEGTKEKLNTANAPQ